MIDRKRAIKELNNDIMFIASKFADTDMTIKQALEAQEQNAEFLSTEGEIAILLGGTEPDNLTELKGQLVDIVEDYLTEKCVPDKDVVFIKGDDYDMLADKFAETLKNWNLI